jgi:hypothetical protein
MIRLDDYDVLVACEESGMVRDALRRAGVRAISCDLGPSRRPGPHWQGDVRHIIGRPWRGLIAHPVCRYLANSGSKHLYRRIDGVWAVENGRDEERWRLLQEGADFFNLFSNARHIPRRAVENSIMHGHAIALTTGRRADQYTQPWMFGDPFTKAAGWWLEDLPRLVATHTRADYEAIHAKCWRMGPSPDRERLRSETEPGLAGAIGLQWGPLLR